MLKLLESHSIYLLVESIRGDAFARCFIRADIDEAQIHTRVVVQIVAARRHSFAGSCALIKAARASFVYA